MHYQATTALKRIRRLKKRLKIIQGGSCFCAGTLVAMADGSYRPIENVVKGDSVLSLSCNHEIIESEVYDCWENEPNKPILSFFIGNEKIQATYDHKFYTSEGYQELYRIVWGALEAGQRVQLELLCKQHGQAFDPNPPRREDTRHNETCGLSLEEQTKELPHTENGDEQQDGTCSSCSSHNMDTKSTEAPADRPHKREQPGQPNREPGMGDPVREPKEGYQDGGNETEAGRTKREVKAKGRAGNGNTQGVGRDTSVQQEAVGGEVWSIGMLHKGYVGATHLQPFAPKHIQVQEPEKTFAISVRNVNYFVSKENVNVSNSAGKTIAILLLLIDRAQRDTSQKVYSIVSETMPHLKRGAIRDFLNIMENHGYYKDESWNRSDFIYTFETGSKIEFFSADSSDKVRGPRRNGDLFINECNNVTYDVYTQLAIRTEGDIFLDYNPVVEFWVQDEIINRNVEHDFLILTYKQNEGLSEAIITELERRKGNAAWWRVYGEGLVGEVEGRVYTGWQIIDEIPHGARLERHGLDFGFNPDPAVIVDVYYYDGGYILDEVLYQLGLHNDDLAMALKNLKPCITIADSAEPKSISEIARFGVSIIPTPKGKDSKKWGIQAMQGVPISITKRSVNGLDEYRKYMLAQDKERRFIPGETVGKDDFLDAARYAITSLIPVIQQYDMIENMPHRHRKERTNPAY